jgi:hypothetical protein
MTTWSPEESQLIGAADELEIAVRRADGSLRRWVPIWVVCVDRHVYVRTWYARSDGWFGHVLQSRRARIRVPGVQADVIVTDVGSDPADVRTGLDGAYRTKYGHHGNDTVERMVADSAADTTLRLEPEASRARDASEG